MPVCLPESTAVAPPAQGDPTSEAEPGHDTAPVEGQAMTTSEGADDPREEGGEDNALVRQTGQAQYSPRKDDDDKGPPKPEGPTSA